MPARWGCCAGAGSGRSGPSGRTPRRAARRSPRSCCAWTPIVRVRRVVELLMAADTVIGNRYAANFDVLHLDAGRGLAVVADGMGGGRGSEVAGRTAVDVVAATAGPGPDALRSAVQAA